MPGAVLGTLGTFSQSPPWSCELRERLLARVTQPVRSLVFLPSEPRLWSAAAVSLTRWGTLSKPLLSLGLSFPTCKRWEEDWLRSLPTLTI